MLCMEVCPLAVFGSEDISEVPQVVFIMTDEFSANIHTYTSGLSSSFLETRVGHFGSTFHNAPPGHSV